MKNQFFLKLSFYLFLNTLFFNQSLAQNIEQLTVVADCEQSTAEAELNINNVRAKLAIGGDLWWNGGNGQYIVPKPGPGEPEVTAFHVGGIWIGGFDSGSNLKLAAQTYGRASGKTDYWPGPLSENGTTTMENCNNFDQFWSTNSSDIEAHIADWNDNGVIDGPIPQSVLAWPGIGNPDFESIHGFELPNTNQGLAPFFDNNSNGIYEPESGDYPNINSADQGIWWVFNDAGGVHSQTGAIPVQMEIQALAYSYSSSNDNINNATFYDYKFINRALDQIDSTYVALWADPDLGCYIDDYIGCDTTQNLGYVYNKDALDGISSCDDCLGLNTYCEEIPIVGIKILRGVLAPKIFCNGIDASDGLCNPPLNSPVTPDTIVELGLSTFMYYNGNSFPGGGGGTALDFYNLMSASWPDDTRLTVGGDGYNPGSTDYTNYAFPSPPNDTTGWSMCSEEIEDGDRRMIMGLGPFRLDPGAINKLSFAVIFAEDVQHPCPDISPLIEAAEDVEDLYDGNITSVEELAKASANIQFQPNPMTNQAQLIFNELENSIQQVSVYSIDGKLMRVYDSVFGESLTIEKGGLGQGMYFYKILTDDFKVYSGKFVVQ